MNERIHLPPQHTPIPDQAPLIFLAGPIQGAKDWQTPTALQLSEHIPELHVASPRRLSATGFDYNEQITWEKDHLKRSRELGVIMFWFAAQDPTLEYKAGRPYAQTSRIEIGRALGWHDSNPFPLVIGIEPGYTENGGGSERYFRSLAEEANIPVFDDLEEVIDQSILKI